MLTSNANVKLEYVRFDDDLVQQVVRIARDYGGDEQSVTLPKRRVEGGGAPESPVRQSGSDETEAGARERVIEYLAEHGTMANADLRALLGVSSDKATQILSALRLDGVVEFVGPTRGPRVRYRLKQRD